MLLLGVGGNVSQGILKAIRNYDFGNKKINVIGACISPDSVGLYMCDKAMLCPYASEAGFVDWVIEVCNRENIQIVLTGVEENIIALQKEITKFQRETRAVFVASDYEMLRIGQDKYMTCKWLEEHGCAYPSYCMLDDETGVEKLIQDKGFPLIAKPKNGKGSRGVYLLQSNNQFDAVVGNMSEEDKKAYVLQECIGDAEHEYTVGCYCDKEGILRDTIIMHRKLEHGSSAVVEVIEDEAIRQEVLRICKEFKPGGPLNVQMRKSKDGIPVCFELNVRFSGTTPMRSHFGYQDVAAMIKEYVLGETIDDCFKVQGGVAYRYTNEFYLNGNAAKRLRDGEKAVNMIEYELEQQKLR